MAYIPDQQMNTGFFLPTTQVWDVSRLFEIDVTSVEFKELLVRLYQQVNNIALSTNGKTSGLYQDQEFITGSTLFNTATPNNPLVARSIFRKTFNTGALGAGVTTIAHGLSPAVGWNFLKIAGAAENTTTGNYYPLPFAGAAGNNIELRLTNTNIIINNNSGVVFLDSYVYVEYVKY